MSDLNWDSKGIPPNRFHWMVWALVVLTALAAVGAIGFIAYQSMPSPTPPRAENKGAMVTVKEGDFLKGFAQPAADLLIGSAQPKYMAEAKQIVACSRDSAAQAGLDTAALTPKLADEFRHELQRVAEAPQAERGTPYVADAVRFFCAVMNHSAVVAYKKSNKDDRLFDTVFNYHLQQWDQLKAEARRLEQGEQLRRFEAVVKDEIHATKVQTNTIAAVCMLVGAMGLLIAGVLYFAQAQIDARLRRIQSVLELQTGAHKDVPPKTPALPPVLNEVVTVTEES